MSARYRSGLALLVVLLGALVAAIVVGLRRPGPLLVELARAARATRAGQHRALALAWTAWWHETEGDHDEALALAGEAEREAGTAATPEEGLALARVACVAARRGEGARAAALLARARRAIDPDSDEMADLLRALADCGRAPELKAEAQATLRAVQGLFPRDRASVVAASRNALFQLGEPELVRASVRVRLHGLSELWDWRCWRQLRDEAGFRDEPLTPEERAVGWKLVRDRWDEREAPVGECLADLLADARDPAAEAERLANELRFQGHPIAAFWVRVAGTVAASRRDEPAARSARWLEALDRLEGEFLPPARWRTEDPRRLLAELVATCDLGPGRAVVLRRLLAFGGARPDAPPFGPLETIALAAAATARPGAPERTLACDLTDELLVGYENATDSARDHFVVPIGHCVAAVSSLGGARARALVLRAARDARGHLATPSGDASTTIFPRRILVACALGEAALGEPEAAARDLDLALRGAERIARPVDRRDLLERGLREFPRIGLGARNELGARLVRLVPFALGEDGDRWPWFLEELDRALNAPLPPPRADADLPE